MDHSHCSLRAIAQVERLPGHVQVVFGPSLEFQRKRLYAAAQAERTQWSVSVSAAGAASAIERDPQLQKTDAAADPDGDRIVPLPRQEREASIAELESKVEL